MSDLDPDFSPDDICIWCAKPYSEHEDSRSESDPVPRVPCLLLKQHFFCNKESRAYKAIDHLQQALAIIQSLENPKNLYALCSTQRAIDSLLRHNTKS